MHINFFYLNKKKVLLASAWTFENKTALSYMIFQLISLYQKDELYIRFLKISSCATDLNIDSYNRNVSFITYINAYDTF